jgi:chaperonin GroES
MGFTPVDNLPRPLHDRVLVRREAEVGQVGSIMIPETAREKCLKGEVLAVGPGKMIDGCFHGTQVKPGDKVLLSPSINRNWPDIIEGSGVVMIQEADILGVLGEAEAEKLCPRCQNGLEFDAPEVKYRCTKEGGCGYFFYPHELNSAS